MMGISAHELGLLEHAYGRRGGLGRTITVGRLVVHLDARSRAHWTGHAPNVPTVYGEELLKKHFGAISVESIDNSDYEGATHIADMNRPLPPELHARYDTVIDFGCLEHIFDVRQALQNLSDLAAPGAMILHVLPANGYCGHGFYQFSPELFFSYYSKARGFDATEVFVADLWDEKHWYKVEPPRNGERVNIRTARETLVLVATQRIATLPHAQVQQSDYVHEWQEAVPSTTVAVRSPSKVRRMLVRERLFAMPLVGILARELDAWMSASAPKRLGRSSIQVRRMRTPSPRSGRPSR